jgi:Protein of unknown function (DUF3253)
MNNALSDPTSTSSSQSLDTAALEGAIFALLAKRNAGSTICPSEAARAVYTAEADWRAAMPVVRALAATLAASKRIEITQAGQAIDFSKATGPIRLRLPTR